MTAEAQSPFHYLNDPFFEPRTMPAHWNLSEFLSPTAASSPNRPAQEQDGRQSDPKTDQPAQAEAQDLPQHPLDPTAVLKTTPANWDLSELV